MQHFSWLLSMHCQGLSYVQFYREELNYVRTPKSTLVVFHITCFIATPRRGLEERQKPQPGHHHCSQSACPYLFAATKHAPSDQNLFTTPILTSPSHVNTLYLSLKGCSNFDTARGLSLGGRGRVSLGWPCQAWKSETPATKWWVAKCRYMNNEKLPISRACHSDTSSSVLDLQSRPIYHPGLTSTLHATIQRAQ